MRIRYSDSIIDTGELRKTFNDALDRQHDRKWWSLFWFTIGVPTPLLLSALFLVPTDPVFWVIAGTHSVSIAVLLMVLWKNKTRKDLK